MKPISSIDELADLMFTVHQHCVDPIDNEEFAASMVLCAVTLAARDGLDDKAIFEMIIRSATSALVTIRAKEEFERRGLAASLEVH